MNAPIKPNTRVPADTQRLSYILSDIIRESSEMLCDMSAYRAAPNVHRAAAIRALAETLLLSTRELSFPGGAVPLSALRERTPEEDRAAQRIEGEWPKTRIGIP